jgi:hypothetical protein
LLTAAETLLAAAATGKPIPTGVLELLGVDAQAAFAVRDGIAKARELLTRRSGRQSTG